MGISGLLPMLKKATKRCNVRKLSGSTVAIDGYCWLHRGAFGCAQKLALGEPTTAYITFCMNFIQILLDNNVKPVVVLDGRDLPSKRETNRKRRERRKEKKELARKYLQQGKKKEAWECFTQSVDVTPAMAREFIKALRAKNIDYVIAPHEADAQLAYLATNGFVDCVITEDSDLVLFGCPKILFKMNNNGDGELYEKEKLPKCMDLTPKTFKFEIFRWMCILSGCDYLESLPKIAMGRAKKVAYEGTHEDIRGMLKTIPKVLEKLQIEVPEEYIQGFIQAENTFLYQLAYDTRKRQVVPLNPYPEGVSPDDMPYAGTYEDDEIHLGVALGNLDIHTLKVVDNFDPLKRGYGPSSIWWTGDRVPAKVEKKISADTAEIGMLIGSPSEPRKGLKKKRPLTVSNSDNEDEDLMNIYSAESGVVCKEEAPETTDDSVSKRRRVTRKPSVEQVKQESPKKKRVVPFLKKSPEKGKKVHVKSRYFKEEVKTEQLPEEDSDETSDEGIIPPASEAKPVLSIYSYAYDSGISQDTDSSVAGSQDSSCAKLELKECSVVISKIPEYTIESDDEEEQQVSDYFKPKQTSSSPAKKAPAGKSPRQKTPTGKAGKSTGSRKPGLSKPARKDSKQRSVADMFARN